MSVTPDTAMRHSAVAAAMWSDAQPVASRFTTFVLACLLEHTYGDAGGFGAWLPVDDPRFGALAEVVESDTWIDEGLHVLEAHDLVAWHAFTPSSTGGEGVLLRVELGESWRDRVPEFLLEIGRATGRRHGMFVNRGQ